MFKCISLCALTALGAGAQAPAPVPPQPKVDRSPRPGVGDLLVAPQRLILEGTARSGELLLQNTGPRTATYRVSFIQMAMDEHGNLKEFSEKLPGGKYADDIVRYSPRQVTLEPKATQTLRITLRRPEGLAPGEYRSHLVLRAVPDPDPVGSGGPDEPVTGIAVRLTPIYGVAIPIIVRHGSTAGSVSWEHAQLKAGASVPTVEASLARSGNQSVYGNLVALFQPRSGGDPVIVGRMTMVAVYDGLPRRIFSIPLNLPGGPEAKGTLTLSFLHPETASSLAETRLEIQ